jgi:hypothetical protein
MENKLKMKTPSSNEFKRFDDFIKEIVKVPKKDIEEREKAEKQKKEKRKAKV